MSIYAVKRKDGGVSILHTVQQPDGSWPTPESCIAKWALEEQAQVVSVREMTEAELPSSRTFRGAWVDTGKVEIDLVKAQNIHMGRIRASRDAELQRTDGVYLRAQEVGDTLEVERLSALRQRLRDVPQTLNLLIPQTPEELDVFWPTIVPRPTS